MRRATDVRRLATDGRGVKGAIYDGDCLHFYSFLGPYINNCGASQQTAAAPKARWRASPTGQVDTHGAYRPPGRTVRREQEDTGKNRKGEGGLGRSPPRFASLPPHPPPSLPPSRRLRPLPPRSLPGPRILIGPSLPFLSLLVLSLRPPPAGSPPRPLLRDERAIPPLVHPAAII